MTDLPLSIYLLAAFILFCIGLFGALTKRNAIMVLISIELMLNAVSLNFIIFSKYGIHPGGRGQVFSLFIILVAGAEAIVGLLILVTFYRKRIMTANVRPPDSSSWQTYGTGVLAGLAVMLIIIATIGGVFS